MDSFRWKLFETVHFDLKNKFLKILNPIFEFCTKSYPWTKVKKK